MSTADEGPSGRSSPVGEGGGSAGAPIRRVLIDCTYTMLLGGHTGCQRVVRNLVKSLPGVAAEYGMEVVPVVLTTRGVVRFDKAAATGLGVGPYYQAAKRLQFILSLRWLTLIPGPRFVIRKVKGLLYGKEAGRRKYVTPANVTTPAPDALPAEDIRPLEQVPRDSMFRRWRFAIEGTLGFPGQWLPGASRRIRLGPGDVMLLADTTWHLAELAPQIDGWRADGAKVAGVVYDLIPLSHPQFVVRPFADAFRHWSATTLPRLDLALCISAATARAVDELKHVRPRFTAWFHLGSDLDQAAAPTDAQVGEEWQRLWSQQPAPWLMVGTIEPRKDHHTVLDAFEKLWASGSPERLVVCGRGGWLNDSLVRRMECHPEAGRRFWWYRTADDAALDYAYAHCRGLITASRVEGFNLPIVEAMRHGAFVLASDLAVHREVAAGAPEAVKGFFAPGDARALAGCLAQHPATVARTSIRPIDWTASCRQLMDGIVSASGR